MKRKLCVVGVGRWGANHVRTLLEAGHHVGVVDTSGDRLRELERRHPDIRRVRDLNEALRADFDAFIVATPAATHAEIASQILRHQKPVLVEKPLALTVADARRLIDLAREGGANLMVGHVLLFHPAIRKIKELIDAGKIGKLQYLYSNRLNLGAVRTEENTLWSFAPHDISIFQYWIGRLPTRVVSRGGAFLQPHIHDTTLTILHYPDNVVAHVFLSWLHPFKEHRIVVIGSKGMLSYEDSSDAKDILYYEKGIDFVRGEPVKREGPTEAIPYKRAMPLAQELEYFIDRLDGRPIEIADGENGALVLEILEKATASLLSGDSAASVGQASLPAGATAPPPPSPPGVFVHPTAVVDEDVEIGAGTKVWHFSHLQRGARIGRDCSLGQNVNVGEDVVIGDHVKIQNNVSVYNGVTLENYVFCGPSMVFTNIPDPRSKYPQRGSAHNRKTLVREGASIGANATILCGLVVGRHALIGAGAVVTSGVPDYALMLGVPARRKGWACECGEVLPKFKKTVTCPRCSLEYVLDEDELSPLAPKVAS